MLTFYRSVEKLGEDGEKNARRDLHGVGDQMIDRTLNYGHQCIERFLRNVGAFESVLDIGAGQGTDLSSAKKINHEAKLFAIEVYPPNVAELSGLGITVNRLDMECDALPFANEFIDVVIANQFIEHTKQIFWIFHELTRVLRVGGHVILGVPNLASLHNRVLLLMGRQPTVIKSASAHVRGFTRRDLQRFFSECWAGGYSIQMFMGSNFYPFPRAISLVLSRMMPNLSWGIFLLVKKTKEYHGEFLQYPVKRRLETNFYLGPQQVGASHCDK